MGQPTQVSEQARLQYLEAMGITPHVARFRLPNAAPTPVCDWPESPQDDTPSADHGAQLHALIDDVRGEEDSAPVAPPRAVGAPRSARALLENTVPDSESRGADAERVPTTEPATDDSTPVARQQDNTETAAPLEPLRFALQVAALDGRWLIMLAQAEPPSPEQRQLLGNIFHAAGVRPERPFEFQLFQWPMMEGLPVEDPLAEAREGLRAFIAGRRGRGWFIERVLLFGTPPSLARALQLGDEQAALLGVPYWQGPAPEALAHAEGRRDLWRQMQSWATWWWHDTGAASSDAGE
ncbi:hypothetical protein [Kushneria phosphatilytica]|uniref:Uncharacterized protein n=1 Tax=Kushneria phosphatilytica TaxID=657387 RepID=A0A1S1NXH2_9GAMM|nr:hypothetical protein [Kushneria phosphatilytica]OHV10898.1 hypothetical protein BH688_08390 [Kushneria phosphatilytica]QEL12016.1 hypothetical protein FY550_13280 [Kushneria phosphatilytica]